MPLFFMIRIEDKQGNREPILKKFTKFLFVTYIHTEDIPERYKRTRGPIFHLYDSPSYETISNKQASGLELD